MRIFKGLPVWAIVACAVSLALGVALAAAGARGDVYAWWADYPFQTNLLSALDGALIGVPISVLVLALTIDRVREARTRERAWASAERATEMLLAASRRLLNRTPGQAAGADGPFEFTTDYERARSLFARRYAYLQGRKYEDLLMYSHDLVPLAPSPLADAATRGPRGALDVLRARLFDAGPGGRRAWEEFAVGAPSQLEAGRVLYAITVAISTLSGARDTAVAAGLAFPRARADETIGVAANLAAESQRLPAAQRYRADLLAVPLYHCASALLSELRAHRQPLDADPNKTMRRARRAAGRAAFQAAVLLAGLTARPQRAAERVCAALRTPTDVEASGWDRRALRALTRRMRGPWWPWLGARIQENLSAITRAGLVAEIYARDFPAEYAMRMYGAAAHVWPPDVAGSDPLQSARFLDQVRHDALALAQYLRGQGLRDDPHERAPLPELVRDVAPAARVRLLRR